MKSSNYLLILVFISNMANAQVPVPSQKSIAMKQIVTYIKNIPENVYQCSAHFMGMGKYHLLKHDAPDSFKLFRINKFRNIPDEFNSFPWTNSGMYYNDVVRFDYGVCMGQTTAQRKFNVLSFFDKENGANIKVPNRSRDPEEWFEFYRQKIDAVFDNVPEVFPGYANLSELASDSQLKKYIKKKIVNLWAKENIGLEGLEILTGRKRTISPQEVSKLFQDVKEKLDVNINPRLYFSAAPNASGDKKKWIHVMQVYHLEPPGPDGSFTMHVWDPNFPGTEAAQKIRVEPNGTIEYAEQIMAEVNLVPWENFEIGEMLGNLIEFCGKNPQYCEGARLSE